MGNLNFWQEDEAKTAPAAHRKSGIFSVIISSSYTQKKHNAGAVYGVRPEEKEELKQVKGLAAAVLALLPHLHR